MPGARPPGSNISSSIALLALLALAGCKSDGPSADAASGNSPPVISGSPPPSVAIGQRYSFTPSASDADGDPITFSIQAKPGWASFDSATGRLSGTPAAGDEGPYDGVAITASDGKASDSLDFSIEVTQLAEGSVTLSWQAPTKNTDGSALTDLAGYKIYYGLARGEYTESIRIDNPGITTYVVENLSPNTWYFVATSF
ncbi:MAG TPA: putative Ig domain-containing protein, partial [Woeseiaceae bacterium]|nr:putative Ig domain-containing protein [Woeseiaceae bacterium]